MSKLQNKSFPSVYTAFKGESKMNDLESIYKFSVWVRYIFLSMAW